MVLFPFSDFPFTEVNVLLGSQRGFEELERGLPQSDGCIMGFEVLVFRLTKDDEGLSLYFYSGQDTLYPQAHFRGLSII